ncbi:MAG: bifunctional 5,10-methylenetetrahydrofolate dehydrogenase/5,10-methenyltetrahydrofolate cyclohydrolase [Bacteroidetes bacterium]|nr:bifunctional 5,10-methylenetetrahydrofolate dehydrogenase/5,10-methenyltetrahydrofolate cyclohydrolase [Bacteroidota bacterium]
MILDGKKISEQIKTEITEEVKIFSAKNNFVPGLGCILVGSIPASEYYVKSKVKSCGEVGFYSKLNKFDSTISENDLLFEIEKFNNDAKIHGILIQLPLPNHINEEKILQSVIPEKDVDGFNPINVGKLVLGQKTFVPCTALGILEILKRYKIETMGKHVVVVGRSNIVGRPIANLLSQKEYGNAIVTIVHSASKDIASFTKQADILIVAIGKPKFITANMVKNGSVVIDVGINRIQKGNESILIGDVDFENVKNVASAITPVPGGVGPLTIAMLLQNTLLAAKLSVGGNY